MVLLQLPALFAFGPNQKLLGGKHMHGALLRVPDAAGKMNISVKTLWGWISQGRIGVVRLTGRAVRIPEAEIERIISEGYSPARRTA
jgi:excisionase family DNA binding protein